MSSPTNRAGVADVSYPSACLTAQFVGFEENLFVYPLLDTTLHQCKQEVNKAVLGVNLGTVVVDHKPLQKWAYSEKPEE